MSDAPASVSPNENPVRFAALGTSPAPPTGSGGGWFGSTLLGFGYAILTVAAFPPLDFWWACFLAPVPLAVAAGRVEQRRDASATRSALWVTLGVLPLWIVQERWLLEVAGLWYLLLAVYLALCSGAVIAMGGMWSRRGGNSCRWVPGPLRFAIVWTAIEVLRGEVIWGGYAWFLAGHPTIDGFGASAARVWGAYGVSFFLVGVAASVVALQCAPSRDGKRHGALCLIGFAVAWIASCWLAPATGPAASTVRIALVQTNIPQDNKEAWRLEDRRRDFAQFLNLTRQAAAASPRPELIVWPETMFPGLTLDPEDAKAERAAGLAWTIDAASGTGPQRIPSTIFLDELLALQRELDIPMLVGGIAYDRLRVGLNDKGRLDLAFDGKYNAAFLITNGQVQPERYEKLELMAFGEVIPYVWRWKGLANFVGSLGVSGWSFDLDWGRNPQPLVVPRRDTGDAPIRAATPICFEGTMPRVVRRLVTSQDDPPGGGASVVINLSNDGWFGTGSGGREQHLLTMRWRAIEVGLPVLRAVNTGISAAIGADGHFLPMAGGTGGEARLHPWVDGVVVVDVPLRTQLHPGVLSFLTLGNALGWACVGITAVALALIVFRRGAGGRWEC